MSLIKGLSVKASKKKWVSGHTSGSTLESTFGVDIVPEEPLTIEQAKLALMETRIEIEKILQLDLIAQGHTLEDTDREIMCRYRTVMEKLRGNTATTREDSANSPTFE